jgi:hypothetical protein
MIHCGNRGEIPLSFNGIYKVAVAVQRQRVIHTENSGFAFPTLGQHISTFRGYRILFSETLNKSQQETLNKSQQETPNKSQHETLNKSQQETLNKS